MITPKGSRRDAPDASAGAPWLGEHKHRGQSFQRSDDLSLEEIVAGIAKGLHLMVTKDGATAPSSVVLHRAVRNDEPVVIDRLLDAIERDLPDQSELAQEKTLGFAITLDSVDNTPLIEHLLARGIPPTRVHGIGAISSKPVAVLSRLLDAGLDISGDHGHAFLYDAARHRAPDKIKCLLDAGCHFAVPSVCRALNSRIDESLEPGSYRDALAQFERIVRQWRCQQADSALRAGAAPPSSSPTEEHHPSGLGL